MRALRVLVVEDGENTASALIRRLGHVPLAAPGSSIAMDRWATWNPDLLLIDLTAPNIDGIELARRVRLMPETAPKPLVALTGCMDLEYRRQAVDAGFDELLPKPFRLEELEWLLIRVEARIAASKLRAEQAHQVAEASRALNRKAQDGLAEYRRTTPLGEALKRLEGTSPVILAGTIVSINLDRKFGFIQSPGRRDTFFYASSVADGRFDRLVEGQEVEFALQPGRSRARLVRPK